MLREISAVFEFIKDGIFEKWVKTTATLEVDQPGVSWSYSSKKKIWSKNKFAKKNFVFIRKRSNS